MNSVISIESLGKKYLVSHQGRESYTALRDVLADGARAFYRRLFSHGMSPADARSEEFWALKDVSLEVKQGERVGIIGCNGAGKSTLLKILSRITEPTEGCVRIKGRVASLLEVGTGFHPELTGRENIFLNGAIMGMGRAEIARKLDEIVTFAEIEKFLDTPVKRYSSGMYVRLAFAVAAHLDTDILLVDEVLAVGDAHFQKKCLGKMEEVSARNGKTVLFVSHNMGIIRQLCDWGVLLQSGRTALSGSISDVVTRYLSSGMAVSDLEVDLAEHPHRLFGMRKVLQRLFIRNGEGLPTVNFSQFDDISIDIEYDSAASVSLAGAGFILYSQEGIRVGGGNTYMSFMPPHRIPSRGKVTFTLPARQLTPGFYSLTVSLGSHQGALEDKVEHAAGFTITQADIYGTGYLLTKEDGVASLTFASHVEPL